MKFDVKNLYTGVVCQYAKNVLGDFELGESDKLVEVEYVLLYKVNNTYVRAEDLNAIKLFQVKHGNISNVRVYFESYLPDHPYVTEIHPYPSGLKSLTNEEVKGQQALFGFAFDSTHKRKDSCGMSAT